VFGLRLNPRVLGIEPSPTRRIDEVRARMVGRGVNIYMLSTGQPGFPPPLELRRWLAERLLEDRMDLYGYTSSQGVPRLREAIARDLEELGGLDLRSRMFNGRFANREANRLRDEFRAMFYFNEALIPLMKKGGVDRVQLYDLSKDLGQQNDIAKEHPKLVARMKKQANLIYKSVMAEAPEWLTPEEQAAAKKPRGNRPQRPATGAPDNDTAKLLARIDSLGLRQIQTISTHLPLLPSAQ